MKKSTLFLMLLMSLTTLVVAQQKDVATYTAKSYMIPMRDGIKLRLGSWHLKHSSLISIIFYNFIRQQIG